MTKATEPAKAMQPAEITDGAAELRIWAPSGIAEIQPGDNLAALIGDLFDEVVSTGSITQLRDGDVVVVTSKVVSKAEGRVVAAEDREEAITAETVRVVAVRERGEGRHPLRIVENRLGLVMAAAGVDSSNTPDGTVLLLPENPDASAATIREALMTRFGLARLGVVITDTVGRPWRRGLVDIAIGAAGLRVLDDLRGGVDSHGRELRVTVTAVADEIASASELVRGKADGRPVAVVRGLGRYVADDWTPEDDGDARSLNRAAGEDMFREGSQEAYRRGRRDALLASGETRAD